VDLDVRAPVARRQVLEHRERDLWSMCAVDAVIDAEDVGSHLVVLCRMRLAARTKTTKSGPLLVRLV
jgi:hypothetical protein